MTKFLKAQGAVFAFALAFLSRLGQARMVPDAVLAASISYFAVVGVVLGALLTLAVVIGPLLLHTLLALPLPSGISAYLWAWLYVAGHVWLTRGLHHDGLADVVDALGGTPAFPAPPNPIDICPSFVNTSTVNPTNSTIPTQKIASLSPSAHNPSSSKLKSTIHGLFCSLKQRLLYAFHTPLAEQAQRDIFWRIIKDSHLGAFGGMALIMALGGEVLAVAVHVENIYTALPTYMEHLSKPLSWSKYGIAAGHVFLLALPLVLAPAFARALCTLFICLGTAKNSNSLGGKVGAGKSFAKACMHICILCALCLPLSFTKGSITIILATVLLYFLWRLSRKYGGYNGDFLGMLIVCGQLMYLFCI